MVRRLRRYCIAWIDGELRTRYAFDRNGNRLLVEDVPSGDFSTAAHDGQDRLTRQGDTHFTWTVNGHLASKTTTGQTTRYGYDVLGRLHRVELPDGTLVEFEHDVFGRRAVKRVNGEVTARWLYTSGISPVAEYDADGQLVYGNQAAPEYMVRDGRRYRFIKDARGSPVLIVDALTGEVAQRLRYSTWGELLEDTNPGFQPFGYAGGIWDPHAALVRMGARDYDPSTGRFTARDPIGFAGGDTNLYAYVAGDPINGVDPSGLAIDFIADAAIVAYGVGDLLRDLANGCDNFLSNLTDLGLDVAALAIPFVPAGAGKLATMFAGKGVAAAAVLPLVRSSDQATEFVTVTVRYTDGMNKHQFIRKAEALRQLGEQGKLYKAKNPVARDRRVTADYKSTVIKRAYDQWASVNPEFANRAIARIKSQHADHVWELQLGGPDTVDNLRLLDATTNRVLGSEQIWRQIRSLPVGTPIKIKVEGP